ncbi:hypothetical protein V565_332160, partial [Rhizoctonia solani 123E]
SHCSGRTGTTNTTTSPYYKYTGNPNYARSIYHSPTYDGPTSSTSSATSTTTAYHSTPTGSHGSGTPITSRAYKALHGSSTGNTTTTKTTTTTSATPSGKTTTTTERVRFNAGDAVYRLKDGKAQKGVIQSI